MTSHKLIVVIGATGNQGSSVVETYLKEPGWRIRGITRNTSSDGAKELTAKGVEMVAANLDQPESLTKAFEGATAIFSVTDFWHPLFDPANHAKLKPGQSINQLCYELELQQAKNISDAAAKTEGLQRFIYSSVSGASKWSNNKYTWVYHFDGKADGAEYAKHAHPELWKKTSIIQVGLYLTNFTKEITIAPEKVGDGVYEIKVNVPEDHPWPLIAAEEDTGPFVKALVELPAGKNLIAYRSWMSFGEFIKVVSKVTGHEVRYREISLDEMKGRLPEIVGRELAEMFAYSYEFGYEGRADPTVVHPKDLGVLVQLPSVEEWVRKQDWSKVFQ